MIEVYKILSGLYDFIASPKFLLCDSSRTWGNQMKILNERAKFDIRKFSFTNRVTNIRNSLPNHIVLSESTNQFKNRLDTFGPIRKWFMIIVRSCREPEVEASLFR